MEDLVTWLRAQLDKDQEITEKVRADAAAIRRLGSLARDPGEVDRYDRQVRWATADNEAKRRILDLHPYADGYAATVGSTIAPHVRYCTACKRPDLSAPYECLTVRLLALPYADRPGYQESWKP